MGCHTIKTTVSSLDSVNFYDFIMKAKLPYFRFCSASLWVT